MSIIFLLEKEVDDYRGGSQAFTLSIGERDRLIVIGLAPAGEAGEGRACLLEVDEAMEVVNALEDAIGRAKGKE
jgi:hypothetical protein